MAVAERFEPGVIRTHNLLIRSHFVRPGETTCVRSTGKGSDTRAISRGRVALHERVDRLSLNALAQDRRRRGSENPSNSGRSDHFLRSKPVSISVFTGPSKLAACPKAGIPVPKWGRYLRLLPCN
jgi:hypothetical protein